MLTVNPYNVLFGQHGSSRQAIPETQGVKFTWGTQRCEEKSGDLNEPPAIYRAMMPLDKTT
jgi:hypothetical protein